MKISDRTLKAARKAAQEQGMTLDRWADKVLAGAAASKQSPNVETLLREISRKIDLIAEHRNLGESASDQIGSAISELGASFTRIKKSTGRVLGKVRTQAETAVGDVAGKARDAIDQVGKSASGLASPAMQSSAQTGEAKAGGTTAAKPKAKRAPAANKRAPAAKRKPAN